MFLLAFVNLSTSISVYENSRLLMHFAKAANTVTKGSTPLISKPPLDTNMYCSNSIRLQSSQPNEYIN